MACIFARKFRTLHPHPPTVWDFFLFGTCFQAAKKIFLPKRSPTQFCSTWAHGHTLSCNLASKCRKKSFLNALSGGLFKAYSTCILGLEKVRVVKIGTSRSTVNMGSSGTQVNLETSRTLVKLGTCGTLMPAAAASSQGLRGRGRWVGGNAYAYFLSCSYFSARSTLKLCHIILGKRHF